MSRIDNAGRNVFFGATGNITTIILGFVLRTVFIHTIGITYLGVNGLFTNILSVLSLSELGIGTAMNYSLYKPVANKDFEKIKSLMHLFRKAYHYIAIITAALGLLLVPFLKYIIKDPLDISMNELTLFYLVFLFMTVSSYFVSYKYSLVNAEQKNYIQVNIHVITLIITLIVQLIVLYIFHSFLLYILVSAVIGLIQKIFVSLYFKRRYPYLLDKNIRSLTKEEIEPLKKNIIALIYHKIGEISIGQTDNILIASFINITAVGLLLNYNLIIASVVGLLNIVFNSVVSGFGNLIATDSKEKQYFLFKVYRFLAFWIYGFAVVALLILLTPFITLWIGGDMVLDYTVILLIMIDCYFKAHRIVLDNFKNAAGIFEADKYIGMIQGIVNLLVSIVMIQLIGLKGVFVGTIVSGLIANIAKPIIIYRLMFKVKVKNYFKDSFYYGFIISITICIMVLIKKRVLNQIIVEDVLLLFVFVIIIPNMIFYLLLHRREEFQYLLTLVKARSFGKLGKQLERMVGLMKRRREVLQDSNVIENDNKIEQGDNYLYTFQELRNSTRIQLHSYPLQKKNVRTYISSLLYRRTLHFTDHFFWPNGLLALSLEWCYRIHKDRKDYDSLITYYDNWIKKGTTIYKLDYAMNGYSMIYLHQLTRHIKYKQAMEKIVDYLYLHPKDKNGSLPYRKNTPNDIYIDSIGMICPFLCRYGTLYQDNKAIDLAIKQIINFIHYGFDNHSYLPYHGYNSTENTKLGIIGWGRAVGWLLIGMIDSLEYIDRSNPYYYYLSKLVNRIVNITIKYQMSNGYFAWQLTAIEGHIDTSSTAMICYAIKKGVMIGILNKSYLYHSNLGLLSLYGSIKKGVVMDSSAECMGFGMYPQRYDAYPWAQGPATALFALSLKV